MPRPDFSLVWGADNAPFTAIEASDYTAGWVFRTGAPPRRVNFDYFQNLSDQRTAWLGEQMLLAVGHEWQDDVSYDAYAVVRSPVNGQLYRSLVGSNLNNEPSVSGSQWALGVADSADLINAPIATVAAAGAIDLTAGAPGTSQLAVSGTGVSINGFTVAANRAFLAKFTGANTLVNGAALVTNTGANIVTAAGDSCWMRATAADTVEILSYVRAAALPVFIAREERATGVAGPNSVIGVQVRQLNTVATNTIAGASLGSNQVTLPAGTYDIEASAPFYNGDRHRAYLYNVTDSANAILGTSENSGGAFTTRTVVTGRITITAPKVFELRHYTQNIATSGMGDPVVDGFTEVYAELKAERVG